MKYFIKLLLVTLMLNSCGTAKHMDHLIIDDQHNLVGIAKKTDFLKEPFASWFNDEYEDYKLDSQVVEELKPMLKEVKIKAVMGTWCGDSRRETPHFYKLLDTVGFDYENLEMITVNRDKESLNQEEDTLDIQRVPTFIFYKDGKEINRFVEYPVVSLEEDFLAILQEVGYEHSYFEK